MIKKSNKQKILEIKTFNLLSGFTFNYPVFKDWEIIENKKINSNEYYIKLNFPDSINLYSSPLIKIRKTKSEISNNSKLIKNINNVSYSKEDSIIYFYNKNNKVIIDFSSIPTDETFSKEIFSKTIIESFSIE
ncbi:MAG: hypothetical protein WC867_05695 [Candidatus Pacearchaeota archaeon]|jgi:hypothetical protein